MDDDDDETIDGLYENGCWLWDERHGELVFKSDLPEVKLVAPVAAEILTTVEFKEDMDLNEQQRFRKRIQRKVVEGQDFVTLQDIKDVVLFTAPYKIVEPIIINLLHISATERLLRALIFFCQYYLQISEVMSLRTLELVSKIRTPNSDKQESIFQENLEDLRLLVAKEYCNMIKGAGEFGKFHHMGPSKKGPSLYKRESLMFETFIRISVQIIWVALGRKSFTQIELEVHRIFKSPTFNSAEHILKENTEIKEVTPNERKVLLGGCVHKSRKLMTSSPLMNEVHCTRNIDHRIFGLGIVRYPTLSKRLHYMECVLSMPENLLISNEISVGILGLPRSRFDILLREINISEGSSSSVNVPKTGSKTVPRKSAQRSGMICDLNVLYKDIVLPPKSEDESDLLTDFPTKSYPRRPCDEVQKQKWLLRHFRLTARKNKAIRDKRLARSMSSMTQFKKKA